MLLLLLLLPLTACAEGVGGERLQRTACCSVCMLCAGQKLLLLHIARCMLLLLLLALTVCAECVGGECLQHTDCCTVCMLCAGQKLLLLHIARCMLHHAGSHRVC
jgi:hypothetical protein